MITARESQPDLRTLGRRVSPQRGSEAQNKNRTLSARSQDRFWHSELTAAAASERRALKAETAGLRTLHLARLDRGEPGVPEIARDVEIDFGADEAKAFNEQAEAARQRHGLRQVLRFATQDDIASLLMTVRQRDGLPPDQDEPARLVPLPQTGSERPRLITLPKIGNEPVRLITLEKVADEIRQARRRDPAAVVAEQPKLRALLDGAEDDPAQRDLAISVSLELQKELGIPETERRVLTQQGLADLTAQIESAPPAQRAPLLQQVKKSYGAHYERVLSELEIARLDPTTLALARRLDDPVAVQRLGAVQGKTRAALTEGLDPTEVQVVSERVRAAVPGSQAPAAERIALARYQQTGDRDDAVSLAYATLGVEGSDTLVGSEEDDVGLEPTSDEPGASGFTASDRAAQRRRGGSAPGRQTEKLPEGELDRLERRYRDLVDRGRLLGWEFASGNLQHFLDGSGEPRTFSAETLRAFDAVTDAEAVNRRRFDRDWTREDSVVHQRIAELNDGDSVVIELTPEMRAEPGGKGDPDKRKDQPIWSRRIWLSRKPRNALGLGSPEPNSEFELFFGSGNSELQSEGRFRATRDGDTVTVRGRVEHHWKDTYDWHEGLAARIPFLGTIDDDDAVALEKAGRGKSFEMTGTWFQDVTVTLQMVDGKPTDPRIEWGPILENEGRQPSP